MAKQPPFDPTNVCCGPGESMLAKNCKPLNLNQQCCITGSASSNEGFICSINQRCCVAAAGGSCLAQGQSCCDGKATDNNCG